jgi:hypothetical protein
MLVLGAGAGRLAWDLHQALQTEVSVALEINPYFTTVMRNMRDGTTLKLTEFPVAPTSGERSALERTLRAPAPTRPGLDIVLADALRPPFRAGAFDLVVTPWLLDVIGAPAAHMTALVNGLLDDGGCWLYHGSVAFDMADVGENFNLEELIETAGASGFADVVAGERRQPYLQCPDSRHGRVESVVTIAANKASSVSPPPRHQNLPDWIAKGRGPVPARTLSSCRSSMASEVSRTWRRSWKQKS